MIIQGSEANDYKSLKSAAKAQTEGVFEQIPLPACMVDSHTHQLVRTNLAFSNLLEAHGLEVKDIPLPYEKLLSGQKLVSEELTFTTATNRQVTFLLNSGDLLELSPEQHVYLIYLNDITYIKKIEDDLSQNKTRLGQSQLTDHIGFWNADPLSGQCFICPRMAKDWGFENSDKPIATEKIMNAIHPEDREEVWAAVDSAMINNIPYYCEYRVLRPDGSIAWIEARGNYLKDSHGQPFRFIGTSTNITERVEAKIKQKELITQLQEAQEAAEHANKNKSMFLANVSHEIRTPLTAILGFTDLLKDGPVSDTERSRFIETINRNGNALIKIIDDVLDLSKVEANCLELEKNELSPLQLLNDVVDQFKTKASLKKIYLHLDIQNSLPSTILSDSVRIQQVISNLLSNAIKFTNIGGVNVQVTTTKLDLTKAEIKIRVSDTGIGITDKQIEKLFLPFSQADKSTARKFGGTGLGLALSKHLAEALGGSLNIERSHEGVGSTFVFSLQVDIPLQTSPSNGSKKIEQQLDFSPLSNCCILLAEDSADNQYFIEKFLNKHGAQVITAQNGYEVLSLCEKHDFDMILMDIEMPAMDGYEATRILRTKGFRKPILALTAHAMAEERLKTREAGCDSHLTKPIDTVLLLAEIENHLQMISKKKKR